MITDFVRWTSLACLFCIFLVAEVLAQQLPAVQVQFEKEDIALDRAPVLDEPAEEKPDDPAAPDESPEDEPIEPAKPLPPVSPNFIRLHLMDGSVIAGDLSIADLTVNTEFGELTVPVKSIRNLRPGLDSYPAMSERLNQLVEDLGAEDFNKREQAHKEIMAWGGKIRDELEQFEDDGNAERQRHLGEIRKELDELEEDELDDEFEEPSLADQPLIRGDTIATTEFTIVGKIAQDSFTINSKYGPLTVQLQDIAHGERPSSVKEAIARSFSVPGTNLVQNSFKSSGVRVQKGDKIVVRADGQIIMSPWGNNMAATPEGAANFGWYEQNTIPGGALVAKIGNSGKVFKVGSKNTIVAKSSGLLQFAVAMQAQYANQSYVFPGEFKVRLKVEPK